ncbi:hypothetical protein JTE90_022911 [Oedothorax gibbosus]|uniref:Uncharacterized protein n=1 Tax=Oedothorax gibbosus TaxID=931172 RepID=A0AAV6TGU1_9ARAC|nr:hypothetical protein JTE90_022911 [Oedothorax gibbosus]
MPKNAIYSDAAPSNVNPSPRTNAQNRAAWLLRKPGTYSGRRMCVPPASAMLQRITTKSLRRELSKSNRRTIPEDSEGALIFEI